MRPAIQQTNASSLPWFGPRVRKTLYRACMADCKSLHTVAFMQCQGSPATCQSARSPVFLESPPILVAAIDMINLRCFTKFNSSSYTVIVITNRSQPLPSTPVFF